MTNYRVAAWFIGLVFLERYEQSVCVYRSQHTREAIPTTPNERHLCCLATKGVHDLMLKIGSPKTSDDAKEAVRLYEFVGWNTGADPLIEEAMKLLNDLGLFGFMPELKVMTGNQLSSP